MSLKIVHVVEDEESIRRSTHMMLKVLGYEAVTYASGILLLDALPDVRAGCILLDIRMPEVDGLEIQRRLNAAGCDHPIIVMSGHGDLAVSVAALEQGAVAFLEKPFPRQALEEALEIAFLQLEDADGYRRYLESAALAVAKLEPSDRQVLELTAQGHDARSIAQKTGLPAVSVELSRSRIFAHFKTDTLAGVLRVAFAASRAEEPRGFT